MPTGAGASGCTAQLVPFQTALVPPPVARHAVVLRQDTLSRANNELGTRCPVHAVPFQLSANAPAAVGLNHEPTAVHALAAEHDTGSGSVNDAFKNAGKLFNYQLIPNHTSDSAPATKKTLLFQPPTAMHALTAVQETPYR